MQDAIQILQWKVDDLRRNIKDSKRILRKKTKRGRGWIKIRIRKWMKEHKTKIIAIKKAISVLKKYEKQKN